MAKIRDLSEQKEALKTIEKLLTEIKNINQFLELKNPLGQYEISFTTKETVMKDGVAKDKKNKHAAPFLCPDREIVNRFVNASKQDKSNQIKELAEAYNIELDETEKALLL